MRDKMDKNRDGVVDRGEWRKSGHDDKSFDRADLDHNGKIDRDELEFDGPLAHANRVGPQLVIADGISVARALPCRYSKRRRSRRLSARTPMLAQ